MSRIGKWNHNFLLLKYTEMRIFRLQMENSTICLEAIPLQAEISPIGSQGSIQINTISLGDGNNAVGMTGEGNIVHLGNGNNSLALYGSNNSATLGNGNNTLGVEGQNGNFVLGSGHNAVGIGRFSGSEHMTFAGSSVNLIDDIGCGGNTFDLGSSTTALVAADQENINVSGGAAIVSGGSDLNIQIGAKGELMQIIGFSNDLINLDPSLGFASTSDVMSALQSDGKGGSILSLHGHGLIDFAGVDASSLQASNFHIG